MPSWKDEWLPKIKKQIKLLKGEAIKTSNGFSEMDFPWNTNLVLDKKTSLIIEKLLADNSFSEINLTLWEWRVWAKVWRLINPKSIFLVSAENIEISSKWWVFSIEWNWIRSIEWSAEVKIKEWEKIISELTVWVGQELILTDKIITSAKLWNAPELRAISDEFKLSSWYNKNYRDLWNENEEEKTNLIKVAVPKKENWENKEEKNEWNNEKIEEKKEEKIVKKIEHIWEIAFTFEEWKKIEVKKGQMVTILWKVPTNTNYVKVNSRKLTKFIKWSVNFKYNAAIKWNNLKEWENIFKVEAFDINWKVIKSWELKLNIEMEKEEVKEEKKEEEVEKKEEEKKEVEKEEIKEEVEKEEEKENVKSDWPALQITSNKDWESVTVLEWQALEIKWLAPNWTVKITIWEYELKSFKEWDKNFLFRVAEKWGNMTRWELNKYAIEAFDKDWKLIEKTKFTLFIEK